MMHRSEDEGRVVAAVSYHDSWTVLRRCCATMQRLRGGRDIFSLEGNVYCSRERERCMFTNNDNRGMTV
jgi:hypothetical protein